jgi:glycosidase
MGSSPRVLAMLALAALAAGCITPKPPVRYEKPLHVAVVLVRDDVLRQAAHGAPDALRAAVQQELQARNLRPAFVDPRSYQPFFSDVRDTERRLAYLSRLPDQADVTLLVETQATFYSQLSGLYRWTVYLKVSVAGRGDTRAAVTRQHDLPVALSFGHELEPEAVAALAPELARSAATLLDSYLVDRGRSGPASGPSAAADLGSVYLVLVDRFHNGDPANDGATDPRDPAAWHGGDLRGVVDKLDYLRELGVGTVWLTPVFKTRHEPFMGHGAFHGYWVWDLRAVDPRFGTAADLAALADGLHRRGMRLLLDYVVNHVGYEAPLLTEHPDWFHRNGTIKNWADAEEVATHEVHGLPDLAQERPEVYAYLASAAERWITDAHLDGLRLDAVKHVPVDFWRRFNTELGSRHQGLTLLGELFEGSPEAVDRVQREGAFTHMFDFPTAFALRDVFCGGRPAGRLGAVLSSRRLTPDPARLVTFLDNHDMPRVAEACGGDRRRVMAALTAQFAIEGVPALTYGTEAGLRGGPEPLNRGDMVFDAPEGRALKAHVRRLLGLRRAHPALAHGATRVLGLDDGLLRFARVTGDEVALVAVNGTTAPRGLALPPALAQVPLRDAFTGEPAGARPRVAPGETRLLVARSRRPGQFAGAFDAAASRREVRFAVTGAEIGQRDALFVVGSGPELGNWAPKQGAGPLERRGPRHVASLTLPVGVVFAYKLVVRGADGGVRWEGGEDRYVFVGDGEGPLALDLSLRPG